MELLPVINMKNQRINNRKRSIKILPTIKKNAPKMTATTTTSLPKNKTGLFAADTLQEVKSIKHQSGVVSMLSSQHRNTNTNNLLLASSEQNRSLKNDSRLIINDMRNGFRPSTIRHHKTRPTTAMPHRDSKDYSSKQPFTPSLASARLKSEIDQINGKLKLHGDINKISRSQHSRDMSGTPQSALSHSTSCRLSSASTNHTSGHINQRFSSAITNRTTNTLVSPTRMSDTSNKSTQNFSNNPAPSPPLNEEKHNQHDINHHVTHAYQIPQQSNVGSESIFPLNSSPSSSFTSRHSIKKNRHYNGNKSISCPFYVMYFSNLTIQQQQQQNNENDQTYLSLSPTPRKRTKNSSRSQSSRRRINSPISVKTYSTTDDDDDDSMTNRTPYYNNKHFSAKIAAFENENSHLLKDVLRTTSWNHVQA